MARIDGKLPVFLGSDPFGGLSDHIPVIGMAQFDGEGDITIVIESDKLKSELEKLVEMDQIRGLALNIAYMAEPAKKEND
jgi:nitrate reductase NapAB chaperone NapD